jgi:hypothetical protein
MSRSSSVRTPATSLTGFGDYADFFWVETNQYLEGARFDRSPNGVGVKDELIFEIGDLHAEPTNSHNVGNWLDSGQLAPLPNGKFSKDWFNAVDVLSNVARYTDMDIDGNGNWSRQASALDYKVYFAESSVIPDWQEGIPIRRGISGELVIFDDGWSAASAADDFVQRWRAPGAMEARVVKKSPYTHRQTELRPIGRLRHLTRRAPSAR